MRDREKVIANLESAYREAFEKAKERDDRDEMVRLDLDFQRDQLRLEVLLDIRDLLVPGPAGTEKEQKSLLEEGSALIEKAGALRRMTRLP